MMAKNEIEEDEREEIRGILRTIGRAIYETARLTDNAASITKSKQAKVDEIWNGVADELIDLAERMA
jgi:hypothetical protein